MDNPDGNIKSINNYLTSNNQTIRFGENAKYKYGFKGVIEFNPKTGINNLVSGTKNTPFSPRKYTGAAVAEELINHP